MADLPSVLITEILARLPAKSITRFRCVSKPWDSLINDPQFIKLHLTHSLKNKTNQALILRSCYIYSVDFPTLDQSTVIDHPLKSASYGTEVIGSCNGVLCLSNGEGEGIDGTIFYNPAIRQFRQIPVSEIEFPEVGLTWCERLIYGFGFDHVSDDYKLVRVIQFYGHDVFDSEVKVYSLKSNSWRRVRDFPREYFLAYKRAWGDYVNGCLHWVVTRKPDSDGTRLIVGFDLGSEECRIVPQPKDLAGEEFHMNVGVLRSCLCVLCNYASVRSEVWIMEEYGVQDSWTRLFSIAQGGVLGSFEYVRPITFSNDGSSVLLDRDCEHLIWLDVDRQTTKRVKIRGMPSSFDAEMLVESLVPLGCHQKMKEIKPKKKEKKSNKKRDDLDGFLAKGFKLKL